MSARVHHAAIGGFMLGMMLLLIMVTVFFSGSGWFRDRDHYVMFFDGSVNGLRVGAPVAFKGVNVGEVIDVGIEVNTDTLEVVTPVTVILESGAIEFTGSNKRESYRGDLIDKGLRAQLKLQSLLTGMLFVQLDLFPGSEIDYKNIETYHPQFPTVPTDLAELSRTLESIDIKAIAGHVESAARGLDEFLNDPELRALPGNFNRRMSALAQRGEEIANLIADLNPRLARLLDTGTGTLESVQAEVPEISARLQHSLTRFDESLAGFDEAREQFRHTVSEDSMLINRAVAAAEEIARASRALRILAEALEAEPEALLRGKGGQSGE